MEGGGHEIKNIYFYASSCGYELKESIGNRTLTGAGGGGAGIGDTV